MKTSDYNRIQELIDLIAKYDKQYYEEGVSEISDAEYDRLYDEYLEFEKKYPEIKEYDNAPTKRVGAGKEAGTTTGLPKFTHKSPLLSIDRKAKEIEELKDFYEKCGGDGTAVIIEPKLDGITCNINYENGKFVNAATRGNGYIGDLITENFKMTDTKYPKELSSNIDLEVRGEAIIPYDFFKENLMKSKDRPEGYSNPRNAVSGLMRQLNPEDVAGKGIQVMFYDIGLTNMRGISDKDDLNIYLLRRSGFQVVPALKVHCWDSIKYYVETGMDGYIQQVDGFNVLMDEDKRFPQAVCDGLVIKVNSRKLREEIGMSEKGPKWAFAYKFKPLQATTRIDHVEWQVGKSGRLSPVAVFDEISLGSTKITKATLNNIDYMKKLPVEYITKRIWYVKPYGSWHQLLDLPLNKPIESMDYIQHGDIIRDAFPERSQGGLETFKVSGCAADGFWIEDIESEGSIYDGEWYTFEKNRYYFVNQNTGLKFNDIIVVERSNDVIPRIVAIKKHQDTLYYDPKEPESFNPTVEKINSFEVPKICPVCGHPVEERYPLHYCTNPLCEAQIKGKIEHYASRDAMNIVGLGEGIIDQLYHDGYLTGLPSIYNLYKVKDELENLERFGKKKVKKLLDSIEKSKNPELWQFIYSLSIPNVGKRASKDLAQRYHTLDNFLNATKEELLSMESIGEVMADTIINFINNKEVLAVIKELIDCGVKPKEVQLNGDKFKGMTFVITGTLEHPRSYYQEIIEKNGGKVSGSVSKKTSAVLIGVDAGSKESKARELVSKGANITLLEDEASIREFLKG